MTYNKSCFELFWHYLLCIMYLSNYFLKITILSLSFSPSLLVNLDISGQDFIFKITKHHLLACLSLGRFGKFLEKKPKCLSWRSWFLEWMVGRLNNFLCIEYNVVLSFCLIASFYCLFPGIRNDFIHIQSKNKF